MLSEYLSILLLIHVTLSYRVPCPYQGYEQFTNTSGCLKTHALQSLGNIPCSKSKSMDNLGKCVEKIEVQVENDEKCEQLFEFNGDTAVKCGSSSSYWDFWLIIFIVLLQTSFLLVM